MKQQRRALDGCLLYNKPVGYSSNQVLQYVRRSYGAQKAGHTGSLDLLASGMLPICFGRATRFAQYLLDADKTYIVKAKLGIRTETSDAEGAVVSEKSVSTDLDALKCAAKAFTGTLLQTPSIYSALKYQGKPLYHYARAGIDVPRPTRQIHVYVFEVLNFDQTNNTFDARIHCSKGTYIRTLIDDLGEQLGFGAHVAALHREDVAGLKQYQMLEPSDIEILRDKADSHQHLDQYLLPVDILLKRLPRVTLPHAIGLRWQNGIKIPIQEIDLPKVQLGEYIAAFDTTERFLGVGLMESGLYKPKRVWREEDS